MTRGMGCKHYKPLSNVLNARFIKHLQNIAFCVYASHCEKSRSLKSLNHGKKEGKKFQE